jgi:1-deoxy-D-xylulose-5-phosphate synthase
MRFVKPLDLDLIRDLAKSHAALVTLEENSVIGGAGSEVARALEGMGIAMPLLRLGLPDLFIEQGEQAQVLGELGLNASAIVERIKIFESAIT